MASSPSAEINEYVRILLLRAVADLALSARPVRQEELASALEAQIRTVLDAFEAADLIDITSSTNTMFTELIEREVVRPYEVRFAGKYFYYDSARYAQYRGAALKGNPINNAAEIIGGRFWPDVFQGFVAAQSDDSAEMPLLGVALASNRVVTFKDNEREDFDAQTSALIAAVEGQNQIGGVSGLRELILGQLRAGRELIRAGSARIYLLQLTLLESLRFLSTRYEKELIGSLAAALLAALVERLGIGG